MKESSRDRAVVNPVFDASPPFVFFLWLILVYLSHSKLFFSSLPLQTKTEMSEASDKKRWWPSSSQGSLSFTSSSSLSLYFFPTRVKIWPSYTFLEWRSTSNNDTSPFSVTLILLFFCEKRKERTWGGVEVSRLTTLGGHSVSLWSSDSCEKKTSWQTDTVINLWGLPAFCCNLLSLQSLSSQEANDISISYNLKWSPRRGLHQNDNQ